jgi:hypothetical protein
MIFLLYFGTVPNAWCFSSSFYCTNKNICPHVLWISYSVHIIFLLFSKMFSFLYHCEDFFLPDLTVYMGNMVGVNCLPFASTWVHPRFFFVGSVLLIFFIFFVFLLYPIMCLYVLNSVLSCPLRFRIKAMFGSSLPPVVCRRSHILFTSFVFVCV